MQHKMTECTAPDAPSTDAYSTRMQGMCETLQVCCGGSSCVLTAQMHPSGSTELDIVINGSHNWRRSLCLHLVHMPTEGEFLHVKTRLASLIKLAAAWLSHKVPHHSGPKQRKMPKPQSWKAGFIRPLIWVAIDIPSTHLFTKGNRAKNPSLFYSRTTVHWVQNRAANKNECQKGREEGENVENGGK